MDSLEFDFLLHFLQIFPGFIFRILPSNVFNLQGLALLDDLLVGARSCLFSALNRLTNNIESLLHRLFRRYDSFYEMATLWLLR